MLKKEKKAVIDTNVIFSAAYDPFSLAGKLIFAALEGKVTLIAPEICKDELRRNLINKLNYFSKEVDTFISVLPIIWIPMSVYESLLEIAEKLIKGDDAHFVAVALLYDIPIITGDKKLQSLSKKYDKVKAYSLRNFLENLKLI
ncbi:MAG: PIN domain-containing protein [Candidatus Asgardarchaeia archaeon]